MEIRLYLIDAGGFSSREAAHRVMQDTFWDGGYAGRNLDALYDVLTSIRRDAEVRISGISSARAQIGEYADAILAVFYAASARNAHLRLTVRDN